MSRVLVRVAIVAASLAWAGFVFTHTVGDPSRGERIATAVLDDRDARAEVVAPITAAVMTTTGLPAEQRSLVAVEVDTFLQDPTTARTFIDPFAGSWARLLGEDDPRPADFDLTPVLDDIAGQIAAAVPGVDASLIEASADTDGDGVPDPVVVSSVPLPRTQLGWMAGVRRVVESATVVLAGAAAVGFVVAFAIGDRRRVLRRYGVWAIVAGTGWVLVPFVLVWAVRRWATGADSVISVAVEEAVGGLAPVALVLLLSGVVVLAASFVPVGVPGHAPADGRPVAPARPAGRAPSEPLTYGPRAATPRAGPPPRRAPTHTAAPATTRTPVQPTRPTVVSAGSPPVVVAGSAEPPTRVQTSTSERRDTAEIPEVPVTRPTSAVAGDVAGRDAADDPDADPLWDYYS